MSLKSLINALFKLSGGQAMPKTGDYITIGEGIAQFTVSSDGWLKVYSTTTNTTTPWLNVSVNNGVGIVTPCNAFLEALTCLVMPVKKGDSITILYNGVTLGAVQLFKLVGGANRLLSQALSWIRGGLLWLTSSIISARFLNCQVLKHCRAVRTLTLIYRRVNNGHNYIQQVLMDMLNCLALTLL